MEKCIAARTKSGTRSGISNGLLTAKESARQRRDSFRILMWQKTIPSSHQSVQHVDATQGISRANVLAIDCGARKAGKSLAFRRQAMSPASSATSLVSPVDKGEGAKLLNPGSDTAREGGRGHIRFREDDSLAHSAAMVDFAWVARNAARALSGKLRPAT